MQSDISCNTAVEDSHEMLRSKGNKFIDTFRYFHPTECGAYTNWCTVTSARQTNYGTRIDYIFADVELVRKEFVDCVIRPDIDGSDHCPVVATLKTSFQGALKPPALCTKYMPEFAGKQQKLKSYFVKCQDQLKASSQPRSDTMTSKSQEVVKSSLKRGASFGDEKSKAKRQKSGAGKVKPTNQPKTNLFSFFSRPSNSDSSNKESVDALTKQRENLTHHNVLETAAVATGTHTDKDSRSLESDNVASSERTTNSTDEITPSHNTVTSKDCAQTRKAEVTLWKSILTGPRPPPLCSGHKEPCVLRTVKVKGPNQGKQFYCCAKPQGHSSNPQARCNFFKWLK